MTASDPLSGDFPVSEIVAAAIGDPVREIRSLGRGQTTVSWRVEVAGEPLVLLVERPDALEPANLLARATVQSALADRGARCARPVASSCSPGIDDPLRGERPWLITTWTPGAPSVVPMPGDATRDLGALLATLHAIPVEGHGRLEDSLDHIRGSEADREAGIISRWQPEIWPYDGRPLVAHPVARLAPGHLGELAALRDQLMRYAQPPAAGALCHTDLNPAHLYVEGDRLAGLIDFGDAAIVPPALDIASFAFAFGWSQTEVLLQAYEPNSVLRDVRRAEAQQLAVVLALQKIEKHTTRRPDSDRVQHALAVLAQTLPLAIHRDA